MDFTKLHESATIRNIIIALGILVLIIIIFQAGVFVGFRKAQFAYRFGESYSRNFQGPHRSVNDDFISDIPGGHGAMGKIVSVNLPTFVVEGPDNVEKVISIENNTILRSFRAEATTSDLAVDQYVVVLGSPSADGKIAAKLIRLIPPPDQNGQTTEAQ